ncbi:MAG TPA: DNA polymerase III subunit delta [Candidatus Acidoferrales bacterium]|nr:DNA polymerase III subunit delta [Candidatus Acidoferrales bacterium]
MPELSLEQFRKRLESGKSVPAILLLGSDSFLRGTLRRLLVEKLVPEAARAWAVQRLSAKEASAQDVLQSAQSMPMMSPRQVIFVEEADDWERLGEDSREELLQALESYLDDPAPFTTLVFEAEDLDARMKLSKVLTAKALVVALTVSGEGGMAAVLGMAGDLGAELDEACAAQLLDVVNNDLARAHTELRKLDTFARGRRITSSDIDALVISSKRYDVWQLADILALRKRDRAMVFLDNLLRNGEQPPALVGAMAWMYRKLLEAQELPPHTQGWQAARQLGMRPETAEQAVRQSRKIPRAQLLAGLAALGEADNRLKKGKIDQRAVMEFLVARLTA